MDLQLKKGLLITFEGMDGTGKTTHASILTDRLKREGYTSVQVGEPGGTRLGYKIRKLLKSNTESENIDISPVAELFLFAASRAQLYKEVLDKALQEKYIVVSDRFTDSTLAYQGYGKGVPLDQIEQVNYIATQGIEPSLTFLMLPPAEDVNRNLRIRYSYLSKTASSYDQGPPYILDRFEDMQYDSKSKVLQGYREMAATCPRWVICEQTGSIEEIAAFIWDKTKDLIDKYGIANSASNAIRSE